MINQFWYTWFNIFLTSSQYLLNIRCVTYPLIPSSTDCQVLHQIWKIETAQKQKNFRLRGCDTWASTNSCDTFILQHGNGEPVKNVFCYTNFLVRNTRYNAFVIVTSGFSKSESDIRNKIPGISSDMLGISNQKNGCTRQFNQDICFHIYHVSLYSLTFDHSCFTQS